MLSVREAQEKILEEVKAFPVREFPLNEAAGRVLAAAVRAPFPSPGFDNSAMDGYALRTEDTRHARPEAPARLFVAATASAGLQLNRGPRPGEAFRIFTGALIPEGADGVVRQEDVERQGPEILLRRPVASGENLRRRGEEWETGAEVLGAGGALTPAGLSLLASFGLEAAALHVSPRVALLATGSELAPLGRPLAPAQIYESNSFGLRAALSELGLAPVSAETCRDRKEDLQWALATGLERADFLIVTGGVSVGDFDFVKEAAAEAGIQEVFWKVRQKPGKPVFFGKKGPAKFLFGLPGNPASALVCFYEYVWPALRRALGFRHPFLPALRLPLAEAFRKKAGLRHFLKASVAMGGAETEVRILEGQGSHLMGSFARANALAVLPEDAEYLEAGACVEVHLLPALFTEPIGG